MASKAQLELQLQRVKEITQMLGRWGGEAAAVETGHQSRVLGADGVTGQEQPIEGFIIS